MVETRRSSSSSKHSLPTSSPPPSSKRCKVAIAAASEVSSSTSDVPTTPVLPVENTSPEKGSVSELDLQATKSGEDTQAEEVVSFDELTANGEKSKGAVALNKSKKRVTKSVKSNAKVAWGQLLSQCSQVLRTMSHRNPHMQIYSTLFTVGQSRHCNLWLNDSSISTILCKLRHIERGGAPIALLEITGGKGAVLVNGKLYQKNENLALNGGDEVIFTTSGKHAYIFQQLTSNSLGTPGMPSVSILETQSAPYFSTLPSHCEVSEDCTPDVEMKDGTSNNDPSDVNPSEKVVVPSSNATNENANADSMRMGSSSEFDKIFDERERREILKDLDPPSVLISTRRQLFKDSLQKGILNPEEIDVSFDNFPYYLSDTTKKVLVGAAFIHLKCGNKFAKFACDLPTVSHACYSPVLLETLTKALAKDAGARLLIVDSLQLPGGSIHKETDSSRESLKSERVSAFAKRAVQVALQTKKPTSSVEADITGCSAFGSHAPAKQETSTASSKNYTFKTGDRVKFVGMSLASTISSLQPPLKGPAIGLRGKVVLAFEGNDSSKIGVRFDRSIPEGNDLGGRCKEGHGFFCTANSLCLDSSGGEDVDRLAINELFEVAINESKNAPLILFLKDLEKSVIDNRKEKSHAGGLLFTKFGGNHTALLDLAFPVCKVLP
ncbi:hypothetical protein OIU78_011396 [Salix suchowensis]|nr:hypothetical protein OIU78_011396 [Salix suchowensis]